MKKLLFGAVLFCHCIYSTAQDDMDAIFDDDISDSHIAVGTDLITNFSGTLNVYANLRPADFFRAQLGIGFMPFGSYTDLMNIPRREEIPVRDSLVSSGFYYSIGAHFVRQTGISGFDYSYYVDFKHWNYTASSIYDLKKFKACFGVGYSYRIVGPLSFDMHLGVYLAREKVTANELFPENTFGEDFHGGYFDDRGDIQSSFLNGFDFGIGVNYNFGI